MPWIRNKASLKSMKQDLKTSQACWCNRHSCLTANINNKASDKLHKQAHGSLNRVPWTNTLSRKCNRKLSGVNQTGHHNNIHVSVSGPADWILIKADSRPMTLPLVSPFTFNTLPPGNKNRPKKRLKICHRAKRWNLNINIKKEIKKWDHKTWKCSICPNISAVGEIQIHQWAPNLTLQDSGFSFPSANLTLGTESAREKAVDWHGPTRLNPFLLPTPNAVCISGLLDAICLHVTWIHLYRALELINVADIIALLFHDLQCSGLGYYF